MSKLEPSRVRLSEWLAGAAYPLWSSNGIDPRNGGFVEALDAHGAALAQPRRARVQPRQVFAFAQAAGFGWRGDVAGIVARGMEYFTRCYQRPDGLFRTLADADGAPLDDRALLYDQAFALLGYAAAARTAGGAAPAAAEECERRALALRAVIDARLGGGDDSYLSDENSPNLRESNPHMHLLEAYLAWAEIGRDREWAAGTRRIVDLALSRFIASDTGALGECYLSTWKPAPGDAGRIIEPGHQFEWAWLLLRCERWHPSPPSLRHAALRLIAVAEQHGVRNGVAVNSLFDDFTPKDADARLWPQTERLKAALLAAGLTREPHYWCIAEEAVLSFFPYLNTPVPGLWLDVRRPDGEILESPAPASTFYHLVGALMALDQALRGG